MKYYDDERPLTYTQMLDSNRVEEIKALASTLQKMLKKQHLQTAGLGLVSPPSKLPTRKTELIN